MSAPTPGPWEFERLTRTELNELAPTAVALIPLGSSEQHGRHLPAGTDSAIVTEICRRANHAAAAVVPVVQVPTLAFGVAGHHVPFGATVSLTLSTYLDVLTEMGESLVQAGFSRLVFLNGHGGNDATVQATGSRLVVERQLPVTVAAASYWNVALKTIAKLDAQIGPIPGHAGNFETSCMMAIDPNSVRTTLKPPSEDRLQPLARSGIEGAVVSRAGIWEASDGRTDDANAAQAVLGEHALTSIAQEVADFIEAFYRSTAPGEATTV